MVRTTGSTHGSPFSVRYAAQWDSIIHSTYHTCTHCIDYIDMLIWIMMNSPPTPKLTLLGDLSARYFSLTLKTASGGQSSTLLNTESADPLTAFSLLIWIPLVKTVPSMVKVWLVFHSFSFAKVYLHESFRYVHARVTNVKTTWALFTKSRNSLFGKHRKFYKCLFIIIIFIMTA